MIFTWDSGARVEKAWRTFCGSAVTWDLGWLRKVEASGLCGPLLSPFPLVCLAH